MLSRAETQYLQITQSNHRRESTPPVSLQLQHPLSTNLSTPPAPIQLSTFNLEATMKLSMSSLMLATLAEVVVASNCKAGLDYCGPTLLANGMTNHTCHGVPDYMLTPCR
jgi:hypothetical protein